MSNETEAVMLKAVLEQYATPDPKIVGTIPRNGINLAYVSHAEITRILIEIDPMWNWQPINWVDGRPAIHEANGVATMWATLTLLGKSLVGVGSVRSDKPDLDKELVGDFLRNAAMRFGICLSLWSKQDWEVKGNVASISTVQPRRADQVQEAKNAHPANVQPKTSPPDALRDDEIEAAFTTTPPPATKIGSLISDKQKGLVSSLAKEVADGDVKPITKTLFSKENLNTLTTKEGSELIKHLMGMRKQSSNEQPF
jgi:hypothetical protein